MRAQGLSSQRTLLEGLVLLLHGAHQRPLHVLGDVLVHVVVGYGYAAAAFDEVVRLDVAPHLVRHLEDSAERVLDVALEVGYCNCMV